MIFSPDNLRKVGVITQARVGSTRLPGKTLKMVNGISLLEYHLRRLKKSGIPVYLATTHEAEAENLLRIADSMGIPHFRGSTEDVLARFYHCAEAAGLETIVRVTSDCPLVDGSMIARALKEYLSLQEGKDCYLSNTRERRMPRGFDFEIFGFEALENAFEKAQDAFDREHVTPYVYRSSAKIIHYFEADFEKDRSSYRITVDTKEDFEVIRILIDEFKADELDAFGVCKILDSHPEILEINGEIRQKAE